MIQTIQIQSSGGIYSGVLEFCGIRDFILGNHPIERVAYRGGSLCFLNKTSSRSLLDYCHLGVKTLQNQYNMKRYESRKN